MANSDNKINISSANKDIDTVYINIGSDWKEIDTGKINIGGSWKEWWITACVAGNIGVFFGGTDISNSMVNVIDYITISTISNASDFGDLSEIANHCGACSNGGCQTGLVALGYVSAGRTNIIESITISTPSNSSDWGDLSAARNYPKGVDSGQNDRGFFAGGYNNTPIPVNTIDQYTISSASSATDWGDLLYGTARGGACSNDTNERAVYWVGSTDEPDTFSSYLQYWNLSSSSNASSFGTYKRSGTEYGGINTACISNGTNNRGVSGGLYRDTGHRVGYINYITITSTSNTTDFGLLSDARQGCGACSNKTNERGIFAGGQDSDKSTEHNIIDYITISTPSNATDFGDLITEQYQTTGTQNA